MEKAAGSSNISSGDDLCFTSMDGKQSITAGLKARDEVFSQIIGYSNVQWRRMG